MDEELRLRLLRLLTESPELSQRELALRLGLSLGKTNYCLRALIDKGWVKVNNFRNSQNKLAYAYVLTPQRLPRKGIATARLPAPQATGVRTTGAGNRRTATRSVGSRRAGGPPLSADVAMPPRPMRLICVVGARPNFMKIAPIMRALALRAHSVQATLVHTGQHYDVAMNHQFFQQLRIPEPDVSLEVGSGSHAVQTAEIMKAFEPVLEAVAPDAILVVGDVNSTIACALVAAKRGVRVVHVEAGLRSRDRSMPEEINRILTDQLSDRLYVTEAEAIDNLLAEGVARDRIVFSGNVMIDTLFASLGESTPAATTLAGTGLDPSRPFGVVTLHRPSNVDDPAVLARLLRTLAETSDRLPLAFPVHPRTRERIAAAGLSSILELPSFAILPPLGYLEMLGLVRMASVVLTDSGGLQEEATALGVPCLTLRNNTERPITIKEGTNQLVGTDPLAIEAGVSAALSRTGRPAPRPEGWDGHAAERIVEDLVAWLGVEA